MRAMVLDGGAGLENLKPAERDWPTPGPGEVVVRLAAASIVSPGSTNPASAEYMPFGNLGWRPSRQTSSSIASMMTTGSVRGKCVALQTLQSRRQPATATSVRAPQLAQKR